jgi:hypothetical protein
MKNIILISILVITSFSALSQDPTANIKYTSVSPVIDGYIDNVWDNAIPHNIDRIFVNSNPSVGEVGTTTWQALWTYEGIYVLVKVNDDAWFPYYSYEDLGNYWEYDFVELFFDVNEVLKDGGSPVSGSGHYIIGIEPYEGKISGGSILHAGSGIDYSYNVADPSYIAEIFVSFSELLDENGKQVDRTRAIGFDVTVVDTDTPEPERKRISWANTGINGESWNNMDDCGIINLITDPLILTMPNDVSIICGDRVQLDPLIIYDGTGDLSYSWSPTTGLSASDIPNPKVSILTNTTYTLEVFSNDFGSVKDSININVSPLVVNCGSDITITCGGNVQLPMPETNYTASGELSYSWTPTAGLNSPNIAQPTVEIISEVNYALEVSDSEGCTANDSITIHVEPLTIQVEDIEIACGYSARFNVETNYTGSDLLNYLWSPASGLSSTTVAEPLIQTVSSNTYQLRVETQNGCIATDNANVTISEFPEIPSICLVDVNENDNNVVVVRKEPSDAVESYLIYRESSLQANIFDLIGVCPYEEDALFIDTLSNAKQQSYKYKIAIRDKCGFVTEMSDFHKTLHLSINKGTGNDWNLIWGAYEGATISSYKIYRGTSRTDLTEISNVSGSNTSFTDIDAPEGDIYYQVEGILTETCSSLKSTDYASVTSNISSNAKTLNKDTHFQTSIDLFYPNPAHDFILFDTRHFTSASVEIYDLRGSRVLSTNVSDKINISELRSGFYTVKLIEAGIIHHAILIKE